MPSTSDRARDRARTLGAWARFPYSIYGAPTLCICLWTWRHDLSRFVVIRPVEGCIWHLIEQQPRSRSRAKTANASPTAKPN